MAAKTLPQVNRIVIGDVGSGKTIVAFIIAAVYLRSISVGQVVLLAPTEVLAFQHASKAVDFFHSIADDVFQPVVIFITSKSYAIDGEKVTKTQLKKRLPDMHNRPIFWVGTHAVLFSELIQPDMVMVDEQHRFGVKQRQHLTQNGQLRAPHFISFTATPIPRTLALTVYQQLKPHFLRTLASRNPIQTSMQTFDNLESVVLPRIAAEIAEGKKVYVICSKVEDNDEEDVWSVQKAHAYFAERFPDAVGWVHGREKQKKEILQQFKDDDSLKILVSTTVVEVGVDVAAASCVVIINAERFGLSALHQIRGRVGRNDFANNYCFLVTNPRSLKNPRLHVLASTQDGFAIAEHDLKLRGSGDVIGTLQSGAESEIDELMGLDESLYEKIATLARNTDITTLPRLQAYVQAQAKQVWGE